MIIIPTFTDEETTHCEVLSTTRARISVLFTSVCVSQHPDQHTAHKCASKNIEWMHEVHRALTGALLFLPRPKCEPRRRMRERRQGCGKGHFLTPHPPAKHSQSPLYFTFIVFITTAINYLYNWLCSVSPWSVGSLRAGTASVLFITAVSQPQGLGYGCYINIYQLTP